MSTTIKQALERAHRHMTGLDSPYSDNEVAEWCGAALAELSAPKVEGAEPFQPSPIEEGSDRWKVEGPGGYRLRGLNEVNARFQADRMNHAYSLGRQSVTTRSEPTYTKQEVEAMQVAGDAMAVFIRNRCQPFAAPLEVREWETAKHNLNTDTHGNN